MTTPAVRTLVSPNPLPASIDWDLVEKILDVEIVLGITPDGLLAPTGGAPVVMTTPDPSVTKKGPMGARQAIYTSHPTDLAESVRRTFEASGLKGHGNTTEHTDHIRQERRVGGRHLDDETGIDPSVPLGESADLGVAAISLARESLHLSLQLLNLLIENSAHDASPSSVADTPEGSRGGGSADVDSASPDGGKWEALLTAAEVVVLDAGDDATGSEPDPNLAELAHCVSVLRDGGAR